MSKKKIRGLDKGKAKHRIMSLINGLVINYNDTDPLAEIPCNETITGLPYGHENPLLKLRAQYLFAEHRAFIFRNKLDWCITVTPVNLLGDQMAEPVEIAARCKIVELTEATENYIEGVMGEIDMDFYSHFHFSCMVKK